MKPDGQIWLGADPGGSGAFGVAILERDIVTSRVVSSVDEAIKFFRGHVGNDRPSAVGIDAPLWWSSGPSGGRKVDSLLRLRYSLSGGQVQAPNSLRGAAVLQAAMLIVRLREAYPDISVTETHPKALLSGVFGGSFTTFARKFGLSSTPKTEHERDAVIGATAARQAWSTDRAWTNDLSLDRYPTEQDPKSYWLSPVSYFWPEAL